jgi:hypothetical protein
MILRSTSNNGRHPERDVAVEVFFVNARERGNPHKFVDIYKAREADFEKATERVYHSPQHSSQLKLSMIK